MSQKREGFSSICLYEPTSVTERWWLFLTWLHLCRPYDSTTTPQNHYNKTGSIDNRVPSVSGAHTQTISVFEGQPFVRPRNSKMSKFYTSGNSKLNQISGKWLLGYRSWRALDIVALPSFVHHTFSCFTKMFYEAFVVIGTRQWREGSVNRRVCGGFVVQIQDKEGKLYREKPI